MAPRAKYLKPLISTARVLTPPILWAPVRSVAIRCFPSLVGPTTGTEQDSGYYDEIYRRREAYHVHYTKSHYYFLWCVIVDRLVRAQVKSVLDIGCGPGQFAELVFDAGIPEYVGLDFSSEAVRRARERCPQFEFVVDNALTSPLVAEPRFDAVVSMEVLEHIKEDIALVTRIPPGVRCLFTVPSFSDPAHVRTFAGCDAVRDRYGQLFRDIDVRPFKRNTSGGTFFILEGVRG